MLSLLGLGMGFLTLLPINLKFEQFIWLLAFVASAFFIYRGVEEKYFLNGFLLGVLNSVFVFLIHLTFFSKYVGSHPDVKLLMQRVPDDYNKFLLLGLIDFTKGLFYALFNGLFCLVFSKALRK